MGVQALGLGLGTLIHELGVKPEIVTGHDFRGYSASIKMALITGLMAAGCKVHDIGLAVTPMAYFAQFDLDVPCVAMVTASHNDNGWTGVKMGANRPLTFGPGRDDAAEGHRAQRASSRRKAGGSYRVRREFSGALHRRSDQPAEAQAQAESRLRLRQRHRRRVRAAGAGSDRLRGGPARLRARSHLPELQSEHRRHEDAARHARRGARRTRRDVALGFDGDGDRCGVVDNEGEEIFADKVGVMLARDISAQHPDATFVADVKSTGLFVTDPVLIKNGAKTDYWKTGHSYMKRRVNEIGALAGFEKSGHFFFNKPFGRGYDDGLIFALAVCDMLDRNPGKSMADLKNALPKTWGSPTMSPHCADEMKYGVVDAGGEAFRGGEEEGRARSRASRSAISSPSTACASRSRTAPGAWCAPHRTSRSWWWWSKARSRKRACARCSRRSMPCCARIRKSANTIRSSKRAEAPGAHFQARAGVLVWL